MATSTIAAVAPYVELTVLAIWRDWGSHPGQGGFSLISSQTNSKSVGETQLCKRTHSARVLENRDFVLKRFSLPELCLPLVVTWQCLLWLSDGWPRWSHEGHPEISRHQLPSADPKFQRLPGSGKRPVFGGGPWNEIDGIGLCLVPGLSPYPRISVWMTCLQQ